MKIAEPGFDVEFATKFELAAQLFFGLLSCAKFYFECKLRPQI